MKKNAITALIFVIILAAGSCKKEKSTVTPPPGDDNTTAPPTYSGTTDFFVKNSVPVQTFTLNGSTGGTFTGWHGTKFTIPAGAFVDANNLPVTGTVTIKLKEIFVKEEMFFSKVTTLSWGNPLLSDGMFNFKPSFNGEEIKFAAGKKKTAEVPADTLNLEMMGFMGVEGGFDLDFDGVPDFNGVNWNGVDSIAGGPSFYHNNNVPYSYIFVDDSTGWQNVDCFYMTPADISITVNTLNNPNPDSTAAFVWFTGFNAVWDLYQNGIDHSKFESGHVKPVPVSLIAITILDNKIYADIKTYSSLTDNGSYDLNMHEMSEAQLKSAIMALN